MKRPLQLISEKIQNFENLNIYSYCAFTKGCRSENTIDSLREQFLSFRPDVNKFRRRLSFRT